ncbi:MAG TPA: hypothetical protein VFH87_01745 [Candidatus Udaeobacter sp.]|nr:hypothetical protein [Candidatus Udaeobacter sp.]
MRVIQFQVDVEDYTIFILMEDGRIFYGKGGLVKPGWEAIELPEHPMGMPCNPLGPPPEDKR